MKGILKFKLPEEETEHLLAVHGHDFMQTIASIQERIKQEINTHGPHSDLYKGLSSALHIVYEEIDSYGIQDFINESRTTTEE